MDEYTEHVEMAVEVMKGKDNYGEVINATADDYLQTGIHEMGPQVIVSGFFNLGPREVDTIACVGFYIPHDGQCTTVINHMDGIKTIDNADCMFPTTQEGQ